MELAPIAQAVRALPKWTRGVQVWVNGTHLRLSGPGQDDFSGYSPRILNWGASYTTAKFLLRYNVSRIGRQRASLDAVSATTPAGTYQAQDTRTVQMRRRVSLPQEVFALRLGAQSRERATPASSRIRPTPPPTRNRAPTPTTARSGRWASREPSDRSAGQGLMLCASMTFPSKFAGGICVLIAALTSATKSVAQTRAAAEVPRQRPMFVTAQPHAHLRSVADVQRGIRDGHARVLWEALVEKVKRESAEPPLAATDARRNLTLVAQTGNRIMDAALVALLLDDRRYAEATLRQIKRCSIRHVGRSRAIGASRVRLERLVATRPVGHARRSRLRLVARPAHAGGAATRDRRSRSLRDPALQSRRRGEGALSERRSNWMTTVVGGFAIAGMALGRDHPESEWLIDFARSRMESYLSVLGPEGEFNETVQYAGSMAHVVRYFTAVRYATEARDNLFERHSLAKFYRWYAHMTFPPGRVAGFGDPAPDLPPVVGPVAAVASAGKDALLQWLYLTYCDKMADTHRQRALELLYFDAALKPVSPEGVLPLGRAYHGHAKLESAAGAAGIHSRRRASCMRRPRGSRFTATPTGASFASMATAMLDRRSQGELSARQQGALLRIPAVGSQCLRFRPE